MSVIDLSVTKQAVGRHGFIGSLYDIRNDQFEGGNLFNLELATSLISTTDCASSDYFLDENTSQKETLNKLNIEGSMKLSLMAGLVKIDGSAKYLNQTKTDSRTVRVTIIFNVKTKQQHLQVSMADLYKYFTPDALENPNATHCVIGITWGARVAATFEETVNNSQTAEELQGQLSASLKKATVNVDGQAKLDNVDQTNSQSHSLKISFSGDVLIEDVPHSINDVFTIFKKVPSMLKQLNEGKGKQIEFQLYPLKRMAEIFKYDLKIEKRIIKEVENHMILRIESIFEQINDGKRMINDFLLRIDLWKDWISNDWTEVIHVHQTKLMGIELKTQREIALLIEKIRRGEAEEQQMIDLLNKFNKENPCSSMSIDQFIKANARIDAKIDALSRFDQKTIENGSYNGFKQPNPDILLKQIKSIEDFIYKYYDHNVYLLNISHQWEEKNKQNWYKQLRCFNNLIKSQMKTEEKESIFRVIDHDLHTDLDDKPQTCVIYHAFHGNIESKDYYHTSLTTLSSQQLRSIRTENKFSDLSDKDIESRHKKFILAHPSGELDKQGFIDELQERYPNGDPTHYCDHAFNTIDKDKSGAINFAEYMSAVSLMLPGNIDKQLNLTFAMCTNGTSENVSSEELMQFLEAIAELEHGDDAIDSNSIRSVVKQTMEFCEKENDESITKEEFINCLKENHELCVAFLPVAAKYQESATSSSKKSSAPQRYLNCGGRACSTCNGCHDWHRVNSHWTLVDGGKCTASTYFIYVHVPLMCSCKTYY